MDIQEVKADAQIATAAAEVKVAQVQTFWSKVKAAVANHFIPEALQAYKLLSTWAFAAIFAMPEAYQAAGSLGLLTVDTIPPKFQWMVRCGGIVGLYLRLVRQRVKQPPAAE